MPIRYGLPGVLVAMALMWLMPDAAKAQATTAPQDTLSEIVVIPNPYNGVGRTWGPKSNAQSFERIRFANLPNTECDIKIFTSRGNLVMTLHKTAAMGRNYQWDGRNVNNQYIVSDVYLFLIDSPTLGRYVGKFVVIR